MVLDSWRHVEHESRGTLHIHPLAFRGSYAVEGPMLHYTHSEVCIFHDGPLEWRSLALLSQRKTHGPLFSACCKNVPAKAGALLCLPCVWETTQTRQQFRRETWTPGSGCRHQAVRGRDLCPLWHQKGLISRNACFSKPFLKTGGRVKEVKDGLFFIPGRLDRHIFGILSWDLQIPKNKNTACIVNYEIKNIDH